MNALAPDSQEKHIAIDAHTTRRMVPQRYPMLLLDRVKAFYYETGRCVGVKAVSQSDPVLIGHFPDFAIYPGVLIIEALAQNSGMLVSLLRAQAGDKTKTGIETALESFRSGTRHSDSNLFVLVESKIKQTAPVYPGSTIELESSLLLERDGMYICKVCALVDGREVSKGQLTLAQMHASTLRQAGVDWSKP